MESPTIDLRLLAEILAELVEKVQDGEENDCEDQGDLELHCCEDGEHQRHDGERRDEGGETEPKGSNLERRNA
jgi:hypothetical protein